MVMVMVIQNEDGFGFYGGGGGRGGFRSFVQVRVLRVPGTIMLRTLVYCRIILLVL